MNNHVLVCLPFAGAGAGLFRTWTPVTASSLKIFPIQLPGREERFSDPLYTDLSDAVNDSVEQIRRNVDQPYSIFGHCLGAILGFEVVSKIEAMDFPNPIHFFASGSADPGTPLDQDFQSLSDSEFAESIVLRTGYTPPGFDNPELRELILPSIRADVALHENYPVPPDSPLACRLTALRGANDHNISASASKRWSNWTSRRFEYQEIEGGHMYFLDAERELLDYIDASLFETLSE